jgi:hypothetical protein
MRTLFVAALALAGSALFAQQTVTFDRLVLRTHQAAQPDKDDYTVVSFIAQTSDAFDSDWDAYKWGNENGLPNIYSTHSGQAMAVNAVPYGPSALEMKEVPVAFRAPMHGEVYVVSYDQRFMLNDYAVALLDKRTNTLVDLKSASHTFLYDDRFPDRFSLFVQPGITPSQLAAKVRSVYAEQALLGWVSGDDLFYKSLAGGRVRATVTDLQGRTVYSYAGVVGANELVVKTLPFLSAGIYLLQVEQGQEVFAEKFIR